MSAFYTDLLASEARHFRTFVDLAVRAAGGDRAAVASRLAAMGEREGEIVQHLAREENRASVHG
jgi:tRNA-(ms[2]io[6]A)-hydroxylase